MDFSTESLKSLVSDVTTVFTRVKQYAEEAIGTAERTELDQEYESLAERADCYKQWTEKIVSKLEAVVQPNPNMRYGEMLLERMGTEIIRGGIRNLEYLGHDMIEAGFAFGPSSLYGRALLDVGERQNLLGRAEKCFVQNAYQTIIIPLRKFLDEDMKTIAKERKVLETKRLDLDVAKNRLRKAKSQESQNNAERDVKNCQEEFDRQIEITKLLLEGINTAQANHVRCLYDFVACQIEYYNLCSQHMINLQRQISKQSNELMNEKIIPTTMTTVMNNTSNPSMVSSNVTISPKHSMQTIPMQSSHSSIEAIELIYNPNETGTNKKRRARCLNDYKAQAEDELSLSSNEIIFVSIGDSNLDTDWMIGERTTGNGQKGKVPVAYLEILN